MSNSAANPPQTLDTTKKKGVLLLLVGPSGVGKSTISRRLSEQLHFCYIVSATTRPRRPNEEMGKKYEHISREEFFRRLDNDEFLEYAPVYDDYYATPRHPALEYIAEGKDIVMEVDLQGALQVRYHYPDAVLVFVLPPSEQALLQRLRDRARDSNDVIERRLRSARREIHMAHGAKVFDKMVVNDDVDRVVREIVDLVNQKRVQG